MSAVYAIGDIHGYYDRLVELLRWDAVVIDSDLKWMGEDATVCLVGDYFDRGPDGVSAINLIMRLQKEAQSAGGRVVALLGNHDVWILAVHRFGRNPKTALHEAFKNSWLRYGGMQSDLDRLTPQQVVWLSHCPVLTLIDNRLLMHADGLFYAHYGNSIEQVNQSVCAVLTEGDATAFDILLDNFNGRYAFTEYDWYGTRRDNYTLRAQRFLATFGGRQIVHGHTPIFRMSGEDPEDVVGPYTYADGLCVNIDHGLYKDGPGFVYMLPPLT